MVLYRFVIRLLSSRHIFMVFYEQKWHKTTQPFWRYRLYGEWICIAKIWRFFIYQCHSTEI